MALPMPPLNLSAGGGGPSGSNGQLESGFDSSGWVVNFGAGNVESSRAGEMSETLVLVMIGAALLVAWRISRR